MIQIKMLSKIGCCLCDQSLFILKKLKNIENVEILVEKIDNNSKYKSYINKVPVILVNDEEVSIY